MKNNDGETKEKLEIKSCIPQSIKLEASCLINPLSLFFPFHEIICVGILAQLTFCGGGDTTRIP